MRQGTIVTFLLPLVQLASFTPTQSVTAFVPAIHIPNRRTKSWVATARSMSPRSDLNVATPTLYNECDKGPSSRTTTRTAAATATAIGNLPMICSLALLWHVAVPATAVAFDDNDYASDTVQEAVNKLRAATGSTEKTFDVMKDVADIITEGKGVGGTVDYCE
jgi:hypothetical protein